MDVCSCACCRQNAARSSCATTAAYALRSPALQREPSRAVHAVHVMRAFGIELQAAAFFALVRKVGTETAARPSRWCTVAPTRGAVSIPNLPTPSPRFEIGWWRVGAAAGTGPIWPRGSGRDWRGLAGLIRVGEDVVISLEARVDDECAAELNGSNRHNKPQTPQRCALQTSASAPLRLARVPEPFATAWHAVPANGQLCWKTARPYRRRPKESTSAAALAVAATDLEDAFIVRLENGRDVCMLLRATLAPSACGMHLVDLLRTVVPATYGHTDALVAALCRDRPRPICYGKRVVRQGAHVAARQVGRRLVVPCAEGVLADGGGSRQNSTAQPRNRCWACTLARGRAHHAWLRMIGRDRRRRQLCPRGTI